MPADHDLGRQYSTVDVNFTGPDEADGQVFDAAGRLEWPLYDRLERRIALIAKRYGGELHMMSWTAPSRGLPPSRVDYGAAYVFEAGDANIDNFIRAVRTAFPSAKVVHDPDLVFFDPDDLDPDEPTSMDTIEVTILARDGAAAPADDKEAPAYATVDIVAPPAYGPAMIRSAALCVWRGYWPERDHPQIVPVVMISDDMADDLDEKTGIPRDAEIHYLGETVITRGALPRHEDAAIPGRLTISRNSGRTIVEFDAEAWFEQADRAQLARVATEGVLGSEAPPNHETVGIVNWLARNGFVGLQEALSIDGDLTVTIDRDRAMAWLAEARPHWGYAPATTQSDSPAP